MPINIFMDVNQRDMDRVIEFLKRLPTVKFLWRSYGSYNTTVITVCEKSAEGKCISNIRETLEEMEVNIQKFEAAASFTWEKVDLAPY